MVKSISHTLTGSLPIDVSVEYDAAGNRKSMLHSINGVQQDSCNYTYDQLSRLTSETRHINALSGSATAGDYSIGYQYTLGGQVSSVTDPFSSTTNLNYDASGRTESVTGSYGGQSYTYAGDIEYRAWGAVKRNGSQTTTYNNRMQPTQFRSFNRYDYSYHPDGQLRHLIDLDDMVGQPSQVTFHYMSRYYGYDYAGRLTRVDATNNPIVNGGLVPAPFVGSYGYDEFNNLNSRGGYYALNPSTSDSGTFVDNKRTNTGWNYDADGREVTSADSATGTSQTWTYDAAGNQVSISEVSSGTTTTNTLSYDGSGELLYESVTTPQTTKADYVIRSTVLQTVLTKLDASGNKDITYVPTNGLAFPLQTKDFTGNPTVSFVFRDVTGLQESGQAVDPFGARVTNVQPPDSSQQQANLHVFGPPYSGSGWSSFTDANNFSSGCYSAQNNNRETCNDTIRRTMGDEFVNYFFHLSQLTSAENDYISDRNRPYDDPSNFSGARWLPRDDSIPGRTGNFVAVSGHVRYGSLLPQNPPYDPRVDFRDYAVTLSNNNSITDCNKLALLIYKAGQVFGGKNSFYFENRDAIVRGLMSGLTEYTRVTLGGREGPSNSDFRVGVLRPDSHFGGGFHDSGFDARFQDGSNQVRHFIFYFGAGYGIGETAANEGLYSAEGTRDGRTADVALGWEGTKRGASFQGDYKGLAQSVWRHVCGQSSALNLP